MGIEFKNVSFSPSANFSLGPLSFTIPSSCVYALLGPNGSGKTTTLKILSQEFSSFQGEVMYFGEKFFPAPSLSFCSDTPLLYDYLTVGEFLSFIRDLFSSSPSLWERVWGRLRLESLKNQLCQALSKGQRQKVAFAAHWLQNPKIFVLDEPFSALDPVSLLEIRDLLQELKKEMTLIVSSHHLEETALLCDYYLILNQGKILKMGESLTSYEEKREIFEKTFRSFSDRPTNSLSQEI